VLLTVCRPLEVRIKELIFCKHFVHIITGQCHSAFILVLGKRQWLLVLFDTSYKVVYVYTLHSVLNFLFSITEADKTTALRDV
jgi:hypothetical protein